MLLVFYRIDSCIGQHNRKMFLLTVFLYLVNIAGGCYITLIFVCEWDIGLVPNCSLAYATERFVDELRILFVLYCIRHYKNMKKPGIVYIAWLTVLKGLEKTFLNFLTTKSVESNQKKYLGRWSDALQT